MTTTTNALGDSSSVTYDAASNRVSTTDAEGRVTYFEYDALGRVIATTRNYDAGGPTTAITNVRTSVAYDGLGNRVSMTNANGHTTTFEYDSLDRLTEVTDAAGQRVAYTYDAAGNRAGLTYPAGQVVTYTYDTANRLEAVADWQGGQFGYNYDDAGRLDRLTLPNGITSTYDYDPAGRLTRLQHTAPDGPLASYAYTLDRVGNRTTLAETLAGVEGIPDGAYLETGGLAVIEAEAGGRIAGATHAWLTATARSGYTGTAYLHASPDLDALYQTSAITAAPTVTYAVSFSSPGTYAVWLRGYAPNAAGDSAYVGLDGQVVAISGFAPRQWSWASKNTAGGQATLTVEEAGVYTLRLSMREDGLLLDRLLLTAATTLAPVYDGLGHRVAQIKAGQRTDFALDILGLPEVIATSAGSLYLHLPGTIMTVRAGEVRYLLSDGLGSVRQVTDENAEVLSYYEFDPYGVPLSNEAGDPYGYTGEWWEGEVGLLHLRARYYDPVTGRFEAGAGDVHPGHAARRATGGSNGRHFSNWDIHGVASAIECP
jgi:YD repeat-containing protein